MAEYDKLPSNSFNTKPASSLDSPRTTGNKTAVQKVTKGRVVQKRSFGRKFQELLIESEPQAVGSHILKNIVMPAIKKFISDMIGDSLNMFLYGSTNRRSDTRTSSPSYVSYGSSYYGNTRPTQPRTSTDVSRYHRPDDICFASEQDAKRVRDALMDIIEAYDVATVAQFCELSDISSNYTDERYGWKNIASAKIESARNGDHIDWYLVLPKPIVLD